MLGSHIGLLADVFLQIVKLGGFQLPLLIRHWDSTAAAGPAAQGAIGMRQLQFPASIAGDGCLKLVDFIIEPVRWVWIPGPSLAADNWPHIQAINLMFRQMGADYFGDCGKQIDAHQHLFGLRARWDVPWPAHDARLARATLPTSAFALAQR